MLSARIATGLVLILILAATLYVDQRFAPIFPLWMGLCLVGGALAARELSAMLRATANPPRTAIAVAGATAVLASNWIPHVLRSTGWIDPPPPAPTPFEALAWPAWTIAATLMTAFLVEAARYREPGRATGSVSSTMFVALYIGLFGSFAAQLRWLDEGRHGLLALTALIVTAKGTDTGAYCVGRLAGRRKLWPRLSPNKTVEGSLGGLAFGVGGAILVAFLADRFFDGPAFQWGRVLAFGLVISASAQLGDLMESLIKRDCSTKDASAALPGFGGLLDVLDSILFTAPVALALWIALWTRT